MAVNSIIYLYGELQELIKKLLFKVWQLEKDINSIHDMMRSSLKDMIILAIIEYEY